MEKNEVVALSELNVKWENPLKVTYSASNNQIIISGFEKIETVASRDHFLKRGDIILKNDEDEICGYILLD